MSAWFDWIGLAAAAKGEEVSWYKGSYAVTTGDAFAGFFGSRTAHLFGPDVKLVVDLEDLGANLFPLLGALADVVAGIGGNVTYCYGTNLTATYFGPKAEIRRGPTWSKTADSLFSPYKFTGPGQPAPANPDPADKAVDAAVLVLTLLLWGVTAGVELTIKLKYIGLNASSAKETNFEMGLMASLGGIVSSRLMALIKGIENACALGKYGEEFLKGCKWMVQTTALVVGAVLAFGFGVLSGLVANTSPQLMDALFSACGNCLEGVVEQLKEAHAG
jgi:hypothetical protein